MQRILQISYLLFGLLLAFSPLEAQDSKKTKTKKVTVKDESPLKSEDMSSLRWRSVGPAVMGGRITSLAVNESDPKMWWAGTAAGGLLKTVNNGITFEYQFQNEARSSIGDVAVSKSNPEIVWVGTGEANPRNSVSWGNGVYKSVDGGGTWQHMGLDQTFQISSVRIHPSDPDTVYVGALGRLWGPNEQRGLFKTTDGGVTWKKIHYINDETGVIDIQMNPKDPKILLVATYERKRDGFDGNSPVKKWGEGAGLYRTEDGGETFSQITEGMPTCKIGRIGLEFYRKDPNIVYMVLESEKMGKEPANAPYMGITGENAEVGARLLSVVKGGPAAIGGLEKDDIVLRLGDVTVHSYNELIAQIRRHSAGESVQLEVSRNRKSQLLTVALGNKPKPKKNANRRGRNRRSSNPFGVRLGGQAANLQGQQGGESEHEYGGVYKSTDGGKSWARINSVNPRPMYFSEIRTDPNDDKYLWLAGVSLYKSRDGGDTFTGDGAPRSVHVDHHALWIDPADGRHMILGNDGGLYVTYDRGLNWDHHNHVAIGQFYHVTVGPRRNYKIYGGLQDNGSWGGPNRVRSGSGPINEDWIKIGGGDGFVCRVDKEDPDQIYYESQNGGVGRRNLLTGARGRNRPRPSRRGGASAKGKKGPRESYRFNWRTPFILSNHNSRIFYTAGNKVFRSLDRGNKMEAISPEITATKKGSATALAESPRDAKVLYVGTDDGAFWRTQNGGHTWENLFVPITGGDSSIAKKPLKLEKEKNIVVAATNPKTGAETVASLRVSKKKAKGKKTKAAKRKRISNLSAMVPGRRWVSQIVASRYKTSRVYATFDAHRSDDDRPYPVVSEDYGTTWKSIRGDLPKDVGSTRTIAEDIVNPNILYLGCEFGAWLSIDRGLHWAKLNCSNLPTVPVHAFAQHKESGELVAGTHGRSLWILDVSAIRQLTPEKIDEAGHLYQPSTAIIWRSDPSKGSTTRRFVGENPPSGAQITYSLGKKARSVTLTIKDAGGKVVTTLETKLTKGIHQTNWNLRGAPRSRTADGREIPMRFRRRFAPRVKPGEFTVVLNVDGKEMSHSFSVEIDPENRDETWLEHEFEAEVMEAMEGEEGGDEGDDDADLLH